MDYWEYKYVYRKTRTDMAQEIESFLNRLGEQGWELVNIIAASGGFNDIALHGYVFKRIMK